MRKRLLLGFASLIVCGANGVLAQRQESQSRFACSEFDCTNNSQCEAIGCGNCGETPNGLFRCKAAQ